MQQTDWHRLSPLALVVLAGNMAVRLLQQNLPILAGAGAGLLLFAGLRGLIALSLLTLLLIGLSATIYHRRFRFRLEEDAVCVRKGVFRKQELRIRFARIQNVQISHPFYFKPFKLVRFALESPGAAEKEVELPGIPIDLALSMREQIMLGEAAANQEPLPEQSPEPPAQVATLYTAGAGRLFLHGLVTYQLRLVTGIVFVALSATLRSNRLEETQVWQWMADNTLLTSLGATASLLLLLLLLLLVVLLMFLLSGLLAVARYHGYVLQDHGNRLLAEAGLLNRQEQTIRLEKITGLSFLQSGLARLLGLWSLSARQAFSGRQEQAQQKDSFLVPALKSPQLSLGDRLLPGSAPRAPFSRISASFVRVFAARLSLLTALGMLLSARWYGLDDGRTLLLASLLVLVLPAVWLRWRQWGWAVDGDMVWVRRGFLGRSIDAFPMALVQQARVAQSLYQRRNALATLRLALPHGSVSIPFVPAEVAADLANRAVYSAETAVVHRV